MKYEIVRIREESLTVESDTLQGAFQLEADAYFARLEMGDQYRGPRHRVSETIKVAKREEER